jgi:hypothetical protein
LKASLPEILTWGSQVSVAPGRDGGTSHYCAYASPFRAEADVPRAQWAEIPAWPATSFDAATAELAAATGYAGGLASGVAVAR